MHCIVAQKVTSRLNWSLVIMTDTSIIAGDNTAGVGTVLSVTLWVVLKGFLADRANGFNRRSSHNLIAVRRPVLYAARIRTKSSGPIVRLHDALPAQWADGKVYLFGMSVAEGFHGSQRQTQPHRYVGKLGTSLFQ